MTQEQKIEVAEKLASIAYPKNSGHCGYSPYKRGAFAGMNYCQPALEALQKERDTWEKSYRSQSRANNMLIKENTKLKEKLRKTTEWINPSKRKPERNIQVLIQYEDGIELGCYCGNGEWHCPNSYYTPEDKPIGWRKLNL